MVVTTLIHRAREVFAALCAIAVAAVLSVQIIAPQSAHAQTYVGTDLAPANEGLALSATRTLYNRVGFSHFGGANALRYTAFNGSVWQSQTVDSGITSPGSTALLMIGGNPRILYSDVGSGVLKQASFNGTSWSTEIIDSSGRVGSAISATLCGGYICISYSDKISNDLKFAVGSTGSWNIAVVDASTADVGAMSAIVAQSNSRPIIAYSDLTNRSIKVATQDTNGYWAFETLTYPGESMAGQPSLAIASDGTLHLAASHLKSPSLSAEFGLYYARKPVSGTWSIAKVSDDLVGGSTSISLKADGTPQIAGRYARPGSGSGVRVFELQSSGLFQLTEFSGALGGVGRVDEYDHIDLLRNFWGDLLVMYRFRSNSPASITPRLHQPLDTDGDGIPDHREGTYGTSVSLADTDGDGMSDGDEVMIYGTSPVIRDGVAPTPIPTPTPVPTPSPPPTVNPVPTVTPTPTPSPTSTPAPTPDPRIGGPDTDGDGLSDTQEATLGTNPRLADTDRDGVSDGQEVTDGSDPLDSGSALYLSGSVQCLGWNSKMGTRSVGVEAESLESTPLTVQVVVRTTSGALVGTRQCSLAPLGRCTADLSALIPGPRKLKSANVCLYHNGAPGGVEGRFVAVRTTTTTSRMSSRMRAATSSSSERLTVQALSSGLVGTQALPFGAGPNASTQVQSENLLMLSNPNESPVELDLEVYSDAGRSMRTQRITVVANGLREIALSKIRAGAAGVVLVTPTDPSAKIVATLLRSSKSTARPLVNDEAVVVAEARKGTGRRVELPISSRTDGGFVEVSNTRGESTDVTIEVRSSEGSLSRSLAFTLPGHRTRRLAVSQLVSIRGRVSISVDADLPSSVVVQRVVLEAPRSNARAREVLVSAREALGAVLRSGFSALPRQATEISILNATDREQSITLSSGSGTLVSRTISIGPRSLGVVTIPARDAARAAGMIMLLPQEGNSVSAWISRRMAGDFATNALR